MSVSVSALKFKQVILSNQAFILGKVTGTLQSTYILGNPMHPTVDTIDTFFF